MGRALFAITAGVVTVASGIFLAVWLCFSYLFLRQIKARRVKLRRRSTTTAQRGA
jgi:hypothetical protein